MAQDDKTPSQAATVAQAAMLARQDDRNQQTIRELREILEKLGQANDRLAEINSEHEEIIKEIGQLVGYPPKHHSAKGPGL
ncbi:MAG: hypothetical protein JO110_06360 [Acetobacteraceae bacterium]|nr:hypothetical protein [Acetobacteraceae bacterium]